MNRDDDESQSELVPAPLPGQPRRTDFGKMILWVLVGMFALQLWGTFGQVPKVMPTTWEYKITAVPDGNFSEEMNKLGKEGWELVTARRASDGLTGNPTFSYEMILKRQI